MHKFIEGDRVVIADRPEAWQFAGRGGVIYGWTKAVHLERGRYTGARQRTSPGRCISMTQASRSGSLITCCFRRSNTRLGQCSGMTPELVRRVDSRECLQDGGTVERRSCTTNPNPDLVWLPIEVEEAIAESPGRQV